LIAERQYRSRFNAPDCAEVATEGAESLETPVGTPALPSMLPSIARRAEINESRRIVPLGSTLYVVRCTSTVI